MSMFSRIGIPVKYLSIFSAASVAFIGEEIYRVETSTSKFEVAAQHLGLNQRQQNALLNIDNMAGYFTESKPWEDVYRSKIFAKPAHVYKNLMQPAISAAFSSSLDSQINILRKNLFGKSEEYLLQRFFSSEPKVTTKQVEDWILYLAQSGFARSKGEERIDLKSPGKWIESHEEEFTRNIEELGLKHKILPNLAQYDECWVLGSTRDGVFSRLIELHYLIQSQNIEVNNIKILAGQRQLNAEMDGISPSILQMLQEAFDKGISIDDILTIVPTNPTIDRTNEGIEYLKNLAAKYNIKLNPNSPTIQYNSQSECPKGCMVGKTYPNYLDPHGLKLTETLMAMDLLASLGFKCVEVDIVDTEHLGTNRPNTSTTVMDAAEVLLQEIKINNNPKTVLLISNQPYAARQKNDAKFAVQKLLEKERLSHDAITLEVAGFGTKESAEVAFSELGAYIASLWKLHNPNSDSLHIMYQTRDNDMLVPPLGEIEAVE